MTSKTMNRWTWVLALAGLAMLFFAGNVQAQSDWIPDVPAVVQTRHAQAQDSAANAGATVRAAAATQASAASTRLAEGADNISAYATQQAPMTGNARSTVQAYGENAVSTARAVPAAVATQVATRVPQIATAVPAGRGARVWRCWENRWGAARCRWMISTGR